MGKLLHLMVLLVVLAGSMVSALEGAGSSGPIDAIPPQITIISPENDSIVEEDLLSETIIQTDSWKVEKDNDKLELGESINEVVNLIGSNELSLLADNNWSVKGIEYNYQQFMSFDSEDNQNEIVTFAEDNGQANTYFYIKDDQQIAKYKLNFESPVPSEIKNDYLTDYKGTVLTLFGKNYVVVNAERTYEQGIKLTLIDDLFNTIVLQDHDISDEFSTEYEDYKLGTLLEGTNHLIVLNGKNYLVQLVFVDSNHAKFIINGEPTPLMNKGDFLILSDGAVFGLDKVLYQDFAGGVHLADFSIKAIDSSKLNVNGEMVEGAYVKIKGTTDSNIASLSSIEVEMVAQDDYYIAPGETLLEQPEFEEKNLLFGDWDIRFDGLEPSINRNVPTYDISLDDPRVRLYEVSIKNQAGEGEYWLTFTNVEDRKIAFPVAYASNGIVSLGSIANRLNLENSNIAKGQYFILNSGTDENSVTNLVQYKQSYGSESNPKIFFTILATGETVQRLVSFDSNGVATATLKFSGTTYVITSVGDASKDNYNISVTGGTETSTSNPYGFENYLIARGGAKITLTETITESNAKSLNVNLSLIEPNYLGDSNVEVPYLIYSVDIIGIDDKVDFTNYAGIDLISPEGDMNNAYGYSINGALVNLNSPSDSTSDTLDIDWPKRQRLPQVYITTAIEIGKEQWLPLEVSTDENAVCSYSLGDGYEEMDTTGAKLHSQNLFSLEDGKDYEVSVQCVDESDNTNTELLKFHFGEVAEPAEETPLPQNPPSNSGGGGGSSSSSSKKTDNNKNKEINLIESNSVPEVKKASEPVTLLADTPAETASTPSSSNKLTAAIIEIAENGGLVYVAGFVLVIASLVGIKIYIRKN